MSIRVHRIDMHVKNMRARMPFRYGITTLTALPHLFLRAQIEVNGQNVVGLAADSLPPKWFTKNPDTTFCDDLADMVRVVQHASDSAVELGEAPSVFDLWHQLYRTQRHWAAVEHYPSLLSGFGVSLVERAMIDAFCRASGTTFADTIRTNRLGIRLGTIYPELQGAAPAELLPDRPLPTVSVRHTIGLGDPLYDDDIDVDDRLQDGLPQSVEAAVHTYNLTHFKVKLVGDLEQDCERLRQLSRLLFREVGQDFAVTLDGNENYRAVEMFRDLWETLVADNELRHFLNQLLFVEQPLHRDVALGAEVGRALLDWPGRPPMIIDESDGELDTLRLALDRGYIGTSHKNSKGVFKSIANACLIRARREMANCDLILSAEDLANVGPVALLQDLAVVAMLGIQHVERNGHHYFAGLSHMPSTVQEAILLHHGDLFHRAVDGFTALDICEGQIATRSVVAAPFGYNFDFDPARFTRLEDWSPESLGDSL